MVKSIDLQTGPYNLEELASTVEKEKDQILLRKGDKLVAVVIPAPDELWTLEEKARARRRFFEMVEDIHQRTAGLDKKALQRLVDEGLKAVRQAKRRQRQVGTP